MTAFSYSTGTPTNIAGANTATMADIKNSFADIATYVNGGNLDATYMSATVFPYRTIETANVNVIAQSGGDLDSSSSSTWFLGAGGFFVPTGFLGTWAPAGIYFDPDDHALTGKTLRLRLVVGTAFCGVVPTSVTFGLYPVTLSGTGGSFNITMGTASGTVTRSPAANNNYVDSVTFAAPVAGSYCFGALAVTQGAGELFTVSYRLEAYWT